MEEEKLQQEELALEALQEISGGISKDDIKKSLIKAKNYISTHRKQSAALGALLIGSLVEGGRGLKDVKVLLTALDSLKERIFSE